MLPLFNKRPGAPSVRARLSGRVHLSFLLIVAALVGLGAYFTLQSNEPSSGSVAIARSGFEQAQATGVEGRLATPASEQAEPAEPDPENDRVSVAPSASQAPPTLTVLWEDGTPLAGVEVALSHAEQILQFGTSDSAGQLVVEAPEASQAHVLRDNHLLLTAPLEPHAASYELRVPLGEALEGVALVDGAPPGQSLEFPIYTDFEAKIELPKWFPPAMTEAGYHLWSIPTMVPTDTLGRFRLDGLSASWSGSIDAPYLFEFTSDDSRYPLEHPRSGVLLELTQRPTLRGIAIDPDGQPAPEAQVSFAIKGSSNRGARTSTSSFTGWVATSSKGVFRIALGANFPVSIELEITSSAGGYLHQTIPLDGFEDRDLGALQLLATRELRFHVTGLDGQPVPGAIVSSSGGRSEPTDAEGQTQLAGLPLDGAKVWADALAYGRAYVDLETYVATPVEILLERAPSLELLFRSKAGDPVAGLRLRMQGAAFLREQPGDEKETQIALGATPMGDATFRGQPDGSLAIESSFTADAEGRLLITGLVPGVRIELGAEDVSAQPLDWKATLVLQAGEARLLEVRLDQPTAWLTGTITDSAGSPIPGSQVHLLDDQSGSPFGPRTNRAGEFRLGPLIDTVVDAWVTAPGPFAPRPVLGHPTAEPLLVQLEEGHDLVVDARDSSGKSWPIQSLSAEWKRRSITRGELQEDGRWHLEHLPNIEFELALRVLDTQLVLTPARGASEATLTIPAPGKLELTWPAGLLPAAPTPLRASINFMGQNGIRAYGSYPLGEDEAKRHARTFEELLPGDYQFTLQWITSDGESKSRTVDGTIRSNQQTDLHIEQ